MALTKSTTWQGLPVPNAYSKIKSKEIIDYVEGETKKWKARCEIIMFASNNKEYGLKGEAFMFDGFETPDVTTESLYTKLKTLPEFEGWVDC